MGQVRRQRAGRWVARTVLAALSLFATTWFAFAAPGDLDALNANVVGTHVEATAVQPDGKTIIVGNFTQVLGVARSHIARLNADGTLDASFDPKASGTVVCVAVQADGKVLLGGGFTTLQPNGAAAATARSCIARVNADGTLDTGFDPKANATVNNVEVQADGKVLLGGNFTTLQPNGAATATARQYVARVSADGTLDAGFDPKASNQVLSVAVQADGKVLLGGIFTTLQPNGAAVATARQFVARVNADGTLDTGFDPKASSLVRSLAVQADGKVLLVGSFVTLQPNGAASATPRQRVARVNADGTLDPGFDPKANNFIFSVAVQADGKVLLGGGFTTLQPNGAAAATARQRVARVNADGTLDLGFDPNANGSVDAVAVQPDGKILLGGQFTTLQPNGAALPTPRNLFARFQNDTAIQTLSTPDTTMVRWERRGAGPAITGGVTFEQSTNGGATYTPLGTATRVGTTETWQLSGLALPASGLLRARGQTACGYGSGSSGLVQQVEDFGPAGSLATTLNANITGNWVTATAVQPDGKTIIAGDFTQVLGVARGHIARLNADGTLDMGFDPKAERPVRSVAVQADGKVLLGGDFVTLQPNGAAAATARQYVARVNADGTLDPGFDPKANSTVYSVAVQADGKVLLGGQFGTLQPNGAAVATARQQVARVNADGTLDPGFDPKANNLVYSVAVQPDGKVLLGGDFGTLQPNGAAAGTTRQYVARVNADGTLDAGFDPKANNSVISVAVQADGKVLLGGNFSMLQPNGTASPTARQRVARVNADGTLDPGFDPKANSTVYSVAVQADGKVLLGGAFATLQPNGAASATARNLFARLNNNPATQMLSAPDTAQLLWTRSGAGPELSRVTFELSTNGGASYTALGAGTRVGTTANWQLSGLSLPTTGHLRARGVTTGGYFNGSSGLIEQVASFNFSGVPEIAVEQPLGTDLPDGGSKSFGGVTGGTDTSLTFTIKNTGFANLTELGITKDGPDAAMFTVTTSPTSPVSGPNGSTTFTVRFAPTSAGAKTAAIHIASNDADENPFDITLTGTGSLSANADLANLQLSPGSLAPTFASATTGYTANVSYSTTNLTVTPTTSDAAATVKVNGNTILSGSASDPMSLAVGPNAITIVVTAADGTMKTYTVTVTRLAPTPGNHDPSFVGWANQDALTAVEDRYRQIYVGGLFTTLNGTARNYLGKLEPNGQLDSYFTAALNGAVRCVAVTAGDKLLFGGSFTSLAGNGVGQLLKADTVFSVTSPTDPRVWYGAVHCIAMQADGKIVIGGDFTSVDNTTRNRIARLDGNLSWLPLDTGFDPNVNGTIRTVAIEPGGKILIGGDFTSVGGMASNRVVRLHSNGTVDAAFAPSSLDIPNYPNCIAVQPGGKILVGGGGGGGLRRFNADGTTDPSFTPLGGSVSTVALQTDGRIIVGGGSVANDSTKSIVRLNADGSLDATFNTSVGNWGTGVNGVTIQADGKILIAGAFITVNGGVSNKLARLMNGTATQTLSVIGASRVEWLRGGTSPETHQVTFELFNSGAPWSLIGAGTRIPGGWELTGLSLPASGYLRATARTIGGYLNGSSGLISSGVSEFGPDSDNDGLLNSWELTYWPSTVGHNANDDFDNDGLTELEELAFGLNPTVPDVASVPAVVNEGGFLTTTITKRAGAAYEVQTAGTLRDGQPESFNAATTTVLLNTATALKVRDNIPASSSASRYLRVKVIAAP